MLAPAAALRSGAAQLTSTSLAPVQPATSVMAPPIDVVVGVANLGRGVSAGDFVLNITALQHCDVICFSEPGDLSRSQGAQKALALDAFHRIYAARDLSHGSYGGVVLLVRKTALAVSHADTTCAGGIEFASARLHRAADGPTGPAIATVTAAYASCSAAVSHGPRPFIDAIDETVRRHALPDVPSLLMGDLNAHHPSFGGDGSKLDARGKLLSEWALASNMPVVGLPTRGTAALDLLLCSTRVCAPEVRTMRGTDHNALVVHVEPKEDSAPAFWEHRAVPPKSGVDEPRFLAKLEGLLRGSAGNLRKKEHQLLHALTEAMRAAGYVFKRVPVRRDHRPPTVEQIMSASHCSAWAAIRLLRAPSTRTPTVDAPIDRILSCFGSKGKQRDHTDVPLVRSAPTAFTPVLPSDVSLAIARNNVKACADPDGISARVMAMASKSASFLNRFAELMNECLRAGEVPPRWNNCDISPIPKPGRDPSEVSNLRPIYLISMLSKTADRINDSRARCTFVPHPRQLGFREGCPIDPVPFALLHHCRVAQTMRSTQGPGKQEPTYALAIAADITDAFPGSSAWGIIHGYGDGIDDDVRQFKIAQLTGRRVRIRYRGRHSEWDPIRDGTNQGTVSGPTDWSAFSKTLLDALEPWRRGPGATKEYAMVADDLSAVIVGTEAQIRYAAAEFFKTLGNWATQYSMKISKKTTAVLVSATQAHTGNAWWKHARWKCQDVEVRVAPQMKLLGYVIDEKLSLAPAVAHAVAKHTEALHMLLPVMATMSLQDKAAIYDSLAVSHIRRIAPVIMCIRGSNDRLWDELDAALATGARCVTGIIQTASSALARREAGLLDARALAAKETIRLAAKFRSMNLDSPVIRDAVKFLERFEVTKTLPVDISGSVVDRTLSDASLTRYVTRIHVDPKPQLTEFESLIMRRVPPLDEYGDELDRDPDDVAAVKRDVNRRMERWVRKVTRKQAVIVFTDGSVQKKSKLAGGAGAGVLFHPDGHEYSATQVCGTHCCSFSAEAAGFECFKRLLRRLAESGMIPQGSVVVVLSDSQSLLAALATGPQRQRDKRLADLWEFLLTMSRDYDLIFILRFIYGHTGWNAADRADEEAGNAARRAKQHGQSTWWKDCARTAAEPVVESIQQRGVSQTFRERVEQQQRRGARGAPRRRPGPLPSKWPARRYRAWPRWSLTLLCQLRSNACPRLGGHLVGRIFHCPRCGAMTTRGESHVDSMVEHAFKCGRGFNKRRQFGIKGVIDLWVRPRVAMDYLREVFFDHLPPVP